MDLMHLHFLYPAWLLMLPLLWGLCLWLAQRRTGGAEWAQLVDPELLSALKLNDGGKQSRTPWPWLALAWTLATLALAGPSWQQQLSPAYRGNAAWVLVLDLSPSMAAADLPPNRATRARYALDDLLGAAHDAKVGLVAFSDEAYTVTPMTDDIATIRALLPPLNPGIMPSAGDNLAPALQQAEKLLKQAGARHGRIVVLSDGFADPAATFAAAAGIKAHGNTVDVVGIGTRNGAPINKTGGGFVQNAQGTLHLARLETGRLQQVARMGGGRYVDLAQLPSLIGDLQSGTSRLTQGRVHKNIHMAHWLDGGIWLLPFLLLATALLARRGWL
jgi:Ca-activated chloride channel homolog